MQTTPTHPHHHSWLIGVPKSIGTCWWKIRYRADALAHHKVPEHNRAAGMYCPCCRKGQPFSDRCAFCGCGFACFVIIQTPDAAGSQQNSRGTASQTICQRPSPRRTTALYRFRALSDRARVSAGIIAVLLLIVLTSGIKAYRSHRQRQYTYTYVQALYGIKSGIALTDRVCDGSYAAWKDGIPTSEATSIETDSRALEDLQTITSEVNSCMGKLGAPPAEYRQVYQILQRLHALYEDRRALTISSGDDVSGCRSTTARAHKEFARDIADLKAQMPAPLRDEFKKTSRKYDLGFMALQ